MRASFAIVCEGVLSDVLSGMCVYDQVLMQLHLVHFSVHCPGTIAYLTCILPKFVSEVHLHTLYSPKAHTAPTLPLYCSSIVTVWMTTPTLLSGVAINILVNILPQPVFSPLSFMKQLQITQNLNKNKTMPSLKATAPPTLPPKTYPACSAVHSHLVQCMHCIWDSNALVVIVSSP